MPTPIEREVEYWEERARELEASKQKTADDYIDQIERQFARGVKNIHEKLAVFYQRFAKENSIPYEEAVKILTDPEKKELIMDVEEFVRLGQLNAVEYNAVTAHLLENASLAVRATRLQAMELELAAIAASVYNPTAVMAYEALYKIYDETFHKSAFDLFKGRGVIDTTFTGVNTDEIADVLRQPWREGVTFSERLWLDQNKLIQSLTDELSTGILNGAGYEELSRNLAKKMDSSFSNAERIIQTEATYFHGQAQKDSMKQLGCKKYQFRSELNSRVCSICGDLDGKIFKYSQSQAGLNYPPMHPNCRCIARPYIEGMQDPDDTRSGRNEEGKSVRFPASMTYPEWYEQVGKKLEENEKKKKKKKKRNKSDPKKPTIRIGEINTLE